MNEGITTDENDSPNAQKHQERQRAKIAQPCFPLPQGNQGIDHLHPGTPAVTVEITGESIAASHPAWQDDGLKSLPKNHYNQSDANYDSDDLQAGLRWAIWNFKVGRSSNKRGEDVVSKS